MLAMFCLHRFVPWLWSSDPVVKSLEAQRAIVDAKITKEITDLGTEMRLLSEMLRSEADSKKELPRHGR